MFGLKTPMTKCRRRNYLDDFDGIRSILSYSNVKDNWTPYVQPQGDLFYVKESDHPGRSDRQYYYSDSVDHKEEKDETTFFADRLRESPYGDKHESRYREKNKNSGYDNVSPDLNNYYEKLGHNKYSHNLYRKEDQNSSRSSGYSDSSPPHQELHNGDINHNSISRNVHATHANNHGYDSDFYDKHSDVSVDRSSVDSTPTKPAKIKHVYITPNPYSCRNGESFSGIALCEKLFGITLYHYNHRQSKSSLEMTYKDRKLLVQHVSLSSPAGRSQQIHRGDMMVAVNDVGVTWENLETICNKLSSKVVKLSFQMPNVVGPKPSPPPPVNPQFAMTSTRPVTTPSPRPPRHRQPGENLSQLVFGDSRQHHLEYLQDTSCCVMYLTLEGDGSSDTESVREDIVYQYPPGDSKLLEVRGLFLTLCGVLPEVASTSARSSTLVHQRQKINIAYQRDGKDVLVIGLPADKVPKSCVEEILKQLHHLILVLYGPLHSAFRDMKHRSQIDQLFSLSLHNLHNISQSAMLSSQSSKIFTELIPGPKAINFTDDTKLLCDEILSEFEASDFDDFLDSISKDARREYSILGSCTFYKEYLLCNHLCQSDLQDIHLFLKHHCIIQMLARKPVEELVVWREMFPSQYCQKVQSCPQGYQDPHDARWFLLVIGMKQFLLCTLLEAGGCSRPQKGNPGPHPFIVSQAKATLLQFEADEVTMTQSIEHRLSKISKGPCLSCADSVITGHKQKKDENIIITPQKSRLSSKNSHDDHDISGDSEHTTVYITYSYTLYMYFTAHDDHDIVAHDDHDIVGKGGDSEHTTVYITYSYTLYMYFTAHDDHDIVGKGGGSEHTTVYITYSYTLYMYFTAHDDHDIVAHDDHDIVGKGGGSEHTTVYITYSYTLYMYFTAHDDHDIVGKGGGSEHSTVYITYSYTLYMYFTAHDDHDINDSCGGSEHSTVYITYSYTLYMYFTAHDDHDIVAHDDHDIEGKGSGEHTTVYITLSYTLYMYFTAHDDHDIELMMTMTSSKGGGSEHTTVYITYSYILYMYFTAHDDHDIVGKGGGSEHTTVYITYSYTLYMYFTAHDDHDIVGKGSGSEHTTVYITYSYTLYMYFTAHDDHDIVAHDDHDIVGKGGGSEHSTVYITLSYTLYMYFTAHDDHDIVAHDDHDIVGKGGGSEHSTVYITYSYTLYMYFTAHDDHDIVAHDDHDIVKVPIAIHYICDHDIIGKGGGSEHSTPVMKRQGSKLSYGSNDSGESNGSVGISNKAKISKAGSVFDITSIPHVVLSQGDEISHIRLTRGVDNCLFHFISINEFEGTYISPTQQEMSVVNGALQEVILNHFYTACLHIRNLFQQSVKNKTKQVDQPKKYGEDMSFTNVKEQGVMFTCVIPQHLENSKKQPPPLSLTYWVVGRKFPDEKEMYVCFHESVPQTAIEMAFKLDSGLSLT
ncbi:INTU [Mytilus coruscus]|uniref:Protein inturned n=1 Tax=Mytilus coruscus TaxID=42192 RepID=A0A6J8AUV3_MYTCO|nr:INTU [Mytilus coruscus]